MAILAFCLLQPASLNTCKIDFLVERACTFYSVILMDTYATFKGQLGHPLCIARKEGFVRPFQPSQADGMTNRDLVEQCTTLMYMLCRSAQFSDILLKLPYLLVGFMLLRFFNGCFLLVAFDFETVFSAINYR